MARRKPELLVPIRDRRKHRRYLTLKNFRNALIVFAVLFAAIQFRSEMRGEDGSSWGRLMAREMPQAVEQKPVEVVQEAVAEPVPDAEHADPLLTEPMARAQWLDGNFATPETHAPITGTMSVQVPRAEASVATGETRVAIVGGAEGVQVVTRQRRAPVLSGGFGR
jgi:hypothetical protein